MTVRSSSHRPTRLSLPARRCANACSYATILHLEHILGLASWVTLHASHSKASLSGITRSPEPSAAGARSNAIHDTAAHSSFGLSLLPPLSPLLLLPTFACPFAHIAASSLAASKSSHSSDGLGGLHELHLQCDTDRFTMIL
eukprot:g62774.t1